MKIQNKKENISSLLPLHKQSETKSKHHHLSSSAPFQGAIRNKCQFILGEYGRSMTEMLGTLAIIGVLSIGAIGGYSYGMDKYRANQTINDIHLRAVDLTTQSANNNTLSLSAWKNEKTNFPIELKENGRTGLRITGVPSRICKMIGEGMENTAEVWVETESDTNNGTDPCDTTEKNTMIFYFDTISAPCIPACSEGKYCNDGICFVEGDKPIERPWYGPGDGTCTTDTDCGECAKCQDNACLGDDYNNKECTTTNGERGQCYWGQCLKKDGCNEDNPCEQRGYYCASTAPSCVGPFPNGQVGVCLPAEFLEKEIGGKKYFISNVWMNWWDANSTCAAIDREMVSMHDLVSDWDGQKSHDADGKLIKYYTLTELSKEIERANPDIGGNRFFWAKEPSSTFCMALRVHTGHGTIANGMLHATDYSPVICY